MKVSTFSERLREAMSDHGWTQTYFLSLLQEPAKKAGVVFNKSDLSQYVNGHVVAKPEKLSVLAHVLGVNSHWLGGEDVPKDPFDALLDMLGFAVAHEEDKVVVTSLWPNAQGASLAYSNTRWAQFKAKGAAAELANDFDARLKQLDEQKTSPPSEEDELDQITRDTLSLLKTCTDDERRMYLNILRAMKAGGQPQA